MLRREMFKRQNTSIRSQQYVEKGEYQRMNSVGYFWAWAGDSKLMSNNRQTISLQYPIEYQFPIFWHERDSFLLSNTISCIWNISSCNKISCNHFKLKINFLNTACMQPNYRCNHTEIGNAIRWQFIYFFDTC